MLLISGDKLLFCVYRMIEACRTKEEILELSTKGQQLLAEIENSPKPVVAAIMGSCLGGGLEVSIF